MTGRGVWLWALLAGTLAAGSASAQAGGDLVTETVFVPPISYVGDQVEARLTLLLPEGQTLLPPLSLPVQDWVLIRDVQVRHDPPFERVTIKYVPFAPGTKTLPPLVLGDVTLDGIKVTTGSLLAKDAPAELLPPRDQLLLPHTELFLFLAFLGALIVPLGLWRAWGPVTRFLQALDRRRRRRRAWRQLHRELKKLQGRAASLGGPEFYTLFTGLVRGYLGARFHRDFGTLTASEVRGLLAPLPPVWAAEWARMVHKADVVRFDGQEPPEAEKLADLEALRREAGRLEAKEAARVDL